MDLQALAGDNDRLAPGPGPRSRAAAARVTRAFAFVDLCNFTAFSDSHGDQTALSELLRLRETLREVVPYFGLRIAKWLGDGAMLVGTETDKLVAATVGIAEQHRASARLPLRAGIAAGEVLMVEGDDYTGRPVNLAARLCQNADPDQILAAASGLAHPEWVEVKDRWAVSVRGLQGDVAVVSIGLMSRHS